MKELTLYFLALYVLTWSARAADKRRRNAMSAEGLKHTWNGRKMIIKKGRWVEYAND